MTKLSPLAAQSRHRLAICERYQSHSTRQLGQHLSILDRKASTGNLGRFEAIIIKQRCVMNPEGASKAVCMRQLQSKRWDGWKMMPKARTRKPCVYNVFYRFCESCLYVTTCVLLSFSTITRPLSAALRQTPAVSQSFDQNRALCKDSRALDSKEPAQAAVLRCGR